MNITHKDIEDILGFNVSTSLAKKAEKRRYLSGFLPYLENLEQQGRLEIIKKQRIYYGSFFIEGHSLVVWRPL